MFEIKLKKKIEPMFIIKGQNTIITMTGIKMANTEFDNAVEAVQIMISQNSWARFAGSHVEARETNVLEREIAMICMGKPSPLGTQFIDFVEAERNSENLNFLIAVHQYKEKKLSFGAVFHDFIKRNAIQQINIGDDLTASLEKKFSRWERSTALLDANDNIDLILNNLAKSCANSSPKLKALIDDLRKDLTVCKLELKLFDFTQAIRAKQALHPTLDLNIITQFSSRTYFKRTIGVGNSIENSINWLFSRKNKSIQTQSKLALAYDCIQDVYMNLAKELDSQKPVAIACTTPRMGSDKSIVDVLERSAKHRLTIHKARSR